MRRAVRARGVEPDECYVLGTHKPQRPDFAIEVMWTTGGIDKLDVYQGIGVPEVWRWQDGKVEVHALRGHHYERISRSELLPELDPELLAELSTWEDQSGAVRALRARIRASAPTRAVPNGVTPP